MDEIITESLLIGRRVLEHLPFCQILADWEWFSPVKKWGIFCRMTIEPQGMVSESTDWYIIADNDYPWGAIDCYPAKNAGLQYTFPHQSYNGGGDLNLPWRNGKVCVNTSLRTFGRRQYDIEPMTSADRLAWHVARLREWLVAASSDSLVVQGDPFELLDFPNRTTSRDVGFLEDRESFDFWQSTEESVGTVDFAHIADNSAVFLATSFKDQRGEILRNLTYGGMLSTKIATTGIWVRIPRVPCFEPWQAPATMGELRGLLQSMGVDVDKTITRFGQKLRDGKQHPLMIGFPIPITVGNAIELYHWQALMLPVLSHGKVNGFRSIESAYSKHDRLQITNDTNLLQWVPSHNWSPSEISTRGRMSLTLSSSRILVLGVGALGSMVAELLGRAGCTDFVIVDGERLQVGNLSRHTLLLSDVCTLKATAVTSRLQNINPHAHAYPIKQPFPADDDVSKEKMRDCMVVIDCTADDTVLKNMADFDWQGERMFFSASVGMYAKRLFLYFARGDHFPHDDFRRSIDPLIRSEIDEYSGAHLPREGIGCWHPVFPARADDLWAMAAIAVKQIEEIASDESLRSGFRVFEQVFEGSQFNGIQRTV